MNKLTGSLLSREGASHFGSPNLLPAGTYYDAADPVQHYDDDLVSFTSVDWGLKKAVRLLVAANKLRIKYDMRRSAGPGNAQGWLSRNGIPVGTIQVSATDVWATYAEDILLDYGDEIQLSTVVTAGATTGEIRNYRMCGYVVETDALFLTLTV